MNDPQNPGDIDLLRFTSLLHDLKNQAHHLVTGLEMLPVAADGEAQRQALQSEAVDLGDQLTQLLLWLRLDRHEHGLQEDFVAVLPLLEDLADELTERGTQAGTTIEVHADAQLTHFFDRILIESVLRSALDNALRHARQAVRLSASMEGNQLCLAVEDDGPGYPEEVLRESVDALAQADPQARRTGLGLMLARGAASAHQSGGNRGSVALERSAALGGAGLRILLP